MIIINSITKLEKKPFSNRKQRNMGKGSSELRTFIEYNAGEERNHYWKQNKPRVENLSV
jgi:hypothetical protein